MLTSLAVVKLFILFCLRCMRIETWVKKQALIYYFWATPGLLYLVPLAKYQNHESAQLAITYNVCYIFVCSLFNVNEMEQ